MIFVGDALFPGGNDFPAREAVVLCIQVKDPHESKRVIETLVACIGDTPLDGGLHRVMDIDGLDAKGSVTINAKKLQLAVAFGPYHGPVTANRLEDTITAARGEGYDALAMAGFSFDPEVWPLSTSTRTWGWNSFACRSLLTGRSGIC